ncbi:MAG: hypothetical protein KKB70_05815 [Proteobacteria bacterium]|nr:hypothetical protein [Pseudomonadota bacterium]MBU1610248.1 hypothetical protein [Pseudomonadota bacterium]
MTKYNVHVYVVCRVKVEAVEAESQNEAISKAKSLLEDDGALFRLYPDFSTSRRPEEVEGGPRFVSGGYAEEVVGYLVDEVDDPEYERTRPYDADGQLVPLASVPTARMVP